MNREVLEQLGEQFELEIKKLIEIKRPDAIILHNKELYSSFLQKVTQIDLIVILPNLVVLIEAKNWVGFIKGGYNDVYWLGRSRSHNLMKVFSPVVQNDIHIRALRNSLRLNGVNPPLFKSLIVVPDGTTINSECKEVINKSALPITLKKIERQYSTNFSASEMKKEIEEVCL